MMDCSKFVTYKKNNTYIHGFRSTKSRFIYKNIEFNIFEKNLTKIPPGFKKVKTNSKIIKEFYCDPKRVRLLKNNKFYPPIKLKYKNYENYFIHDNGGRPFLVYVKKGEVNIYKTSSDRFYTIEDDWSYIDRNNKWIYIKLVKKYKSINIFIGKDIKSSISPHPSNKNMGNTILIQISKNVYVFIGYMIYLFKTNKKITSYYSPVGNNDVPYPFAIDEDKKYYLLLDRVILNNVPYKYKKDPYRYYYDNHDLKNVKILKYSEIHDRI
jgi:hypothetical protein